MHSPDPSGAHRQPKGVGVIACLSQHIAIYFETFFALNLVLFDSVHSTKPERYGKYRNLEYLRNSEAKFLFKCYFLQSSSRIVFTIIKYSADLKFGGRRYPPQVVTWR